MRSNDNVKGTISNSFFNKLAARNVKKSSKDYFIYFFTLMLSVCLFYSFNSISDQFSSLGLEDNLNYLAFSSSMLSVFSILVCVIMGSLVVYANRFLLKRRKKEIGIYATLGMQRKDLNRLLMKEVFRIGVGSLIAGLVLGIFAAQILSLITAKLIGINLGSYSFMISIKAIIMSIIFFGILFFFVHLFNVRELKKMSLLDMLNADRKNETVTEGGNFVTGLLAVLSVIFIIGGYALIVILAGKDVFKALGIGGFLMIAGTVLFFTSFLKIAAKLMKKNKRFYFRSLNMFTTSQFSTRLKTEGISVAMTSVLLFLSLALTIIGPGMGKFIMNGVENATPFDGTIYYAAALGEQKGLDNPMEYLERDGFEINSFSNSYEGFWTYQQPSITAGLLTEERNDTPLTIIGVEDYNRMLALQKMDPIHLNTGEYAVSYAFPAMEDVLKIFSDNPKMINIGSNSLNLAHNGIYHNAWENKNVLVEQGTVIIPQYLTQGLEKQRWILNFNFSQNSKGEYSALYNEWFKSAPKDYTLWAKQEALISITADNLLTTYLGIYLGITFLITSGAALALQQLAQSSDNEKRYELLKKLGTSKKDMRRSLKKQLKIYFGSPLILALLNTAVVVTAVFQYFIGLSLTVIISVIGFSTFLILMVYAVYFMVTYAGGRRMLNL